MALAGYAHLLAAGRRLQWDAEAIDLNRDAAAWPAVDDASRALVTTLVAGFCVAERAVAEQLSPFAAAAPDAVARECFEVQAGDERRHARFFARVAEEVLGLDSGAEAAALAGPAIVALFEEQLPVLAERLAGGTASLPEAVGYYHLVLEGIVFAVGQAALADELEALTVLPGTLDGVLRVQADERWHIGLGVMCLQAQGAGTGPDLGALAARAGAAWGARIATTARVDAVLAVHERRVGQVARSATASRKRGIVSQVVIR